ncbi:hypothetical protein [Paraburkholderia bannensis]|uniref:hypothetical protein n=1 Tax=Paraburkholderia bannensis TaxID=765414 RepID=UPI000488BB1A|nr:hypothetical protein [Paraburkholderia bannensis]
MNIKAIIQKIVSWFKTEAKSVEAASAVDVTALSSMLSARISQLEAHANANSVAIATEQAARHAVDAALAAPIDIVGGQSTVEGALAYLNRLIPKTQLGADVLAAIPESTTEGLAMNASNVNVAIQIALTLKANDPSLTDAAVQAATNAALAAAYPAPAPTPAA